MTDWILLTLSSMTIASLSSFLFKRLWITALVTALLAPYATLLLGWFITGNADAQDGLLVIFGQVVAVPVAVIVGAVFAACRDWKRRSQKPSGRSSRERDELGIAVAPLVAVLCATAVLGSAWPHVFLLGVLLAYVAALVLAWPLVYLLRRLGLVARWHFVCLGSLVALPFSLVPALVLAPGAAPQPLSVLVFMLSGAAAGAIFWQIAQGGRGAL